MATIKSFTSLEQSKKLAEILPLESADMCWSKYDDGQMRIMPMELWNLIKDGLSCLEFTPAWSLAALYSILPNSKNESTTLSRGGWKIEPIEYLDNWWCEYKDDSHSEYFTVSADNPVDACVAMIEKLHELKML